MPIVGITGLLIVGVMALSSCALQPEKIKADPFGSRYLAPEEVVEVTFINKPDSRMTDVYIDGHKLEGTLAYLKLGKHRVKVNNRRLGLAGNVSAAGAIVADIASAPCALGLTAPILFFPLLLSCPVAAVAEIAHDPVGKCDVIGWEMNLEIGKNYKVDVDWTNFPPQVLMVNQTDQLDDKPVIYCDLLPESTP